MSLRNLKINTESVFNKIEKGWKIQTRDSLQIMRKQFTCGTKTFSQAIYLC